MNLLHSNMFSNKYNLLVLAISLWWIPIESFSFVWSFVSTRKKIGNSSTIKHFKHQKDKISDFTACFLQKMLKHRRPQLQDGFCSWNRDHVPYKQTSTLLFYLITTLAKSMDFLILQIFKQTLILLFLCMVGFVCLYLLFLKSIGDLYRL